ncbi:MAG TPA: helix-turn-helix domain-containing protein [Pyrinomonadaceae bacterium]|jgi:tetratricopeptide (TPR) repeat protein
MTLLSSLLRQLENPILSRDQRAELRCQLAKELEDKGEHDEARQAMGELWQRLGERPKLEGLGQNTAAEVLLRVGVLTGWIGSKRQISDAQETAKDFISESIPTFERVSNAKVAEAQTELALCYWRTGDYDEARLILNEVLAKLWTEDELKAKALLRLSMVERSVNRYSEALQILLDNAGLFDNITNNTLKGSYHNNLANLWENIGKAENREDYTDRAFVEYSAASYHFEQAEHKAYCGKVENNLGFLYFKAGGFKEAHEHLGRARRLLLSIKDSASIAEVDETRARVFLAEGQNVEAEKAARASVVLLEQGSQQDLLAEALITHGTALARLRFYSQSYATLQHAIEIAQEAGATSHAGKAALVIMEELGEHLSPRKAKTVSKRNLIEEVRSYEYDLIKQALILSKGRVTQAAKMLGISHQRLIYIIEKRHKDLNAIRTLPQRRPQSLVKHHPKPKR